MTLAKLRDIVARNEPASIVKTHAGGRLKKVGPLVAAAFTLLMVAGNSAHARDLFKADAYTNYSGDVKNGEYMFNASGCAACHAPGNDPKLLSGGVKMDTYVGTVYTPNISPHSAGIGSWTNAQFLNALVHGVSPNGRHYYPIFPYSSYAGMKPEHVLDIKAYIKTLPESDNKVSENEVSFPFNSNFMMALWKRKNFDTPQWQPVKQNQIARGKYLVEHIGACGSCHTPRTLTFGLDKAKALQGNKGLTGTYAPAIHAAKLSSLASAKMFTKDVMMDGKKLNGQPVSDPIKRKFIEGTSKLTEDDRLAMLAYITGSEQKIKKPKLTVAACTAGDTSTAPKASSHASAADGFIGKYCRNCHGPGEKSQASFPANDLESIAANPAFVTPGNPETSRLYTSVTSGRMPIGPRPTDAEVSDLASWITELGSASVAGSSASVLKLPPKRMRKVIPRGEFVRAALDDIGSVDESDRPFVRYFSYRYQFNGIFPCEDKATFDKRMDLYTAGFNKLLNSVSNGTNLVVPHVVSNTQELLVRVDIRELDWETAQWDGLLKDYPFGIDPKADPILSALSQQTDTQVPILRADWFMSNAGRPDNYHALLKLPEQISDLEKTMGVDVNENIKRSRVARGAITKGLSGVSDHNRMLERHDLPRGGYYWKSYDFAGSDGVQSLRRNPHGPAELEPLPEGLKSFKHDGGEMIFSLPNGLQGYFLSLADGKRIDEGPTNIVAYRERPTGKGVTIVNGRSCFDCHANGTISRLLQLRPHIENSNLFSLPQQKLLLKMYVGQSEMDKHFDKDRASFVSALEKIGATVKAADGTLQSRPGPENQEIITWYADLYEKDLGFEELAAEFDMEPEQFRNAIKKIVDSDGLRLALDWVIQLEGGSKVPRFELEKQFPLLVKPLMDLDSLGADILAAIADPTKTAAIAKNEYAATGTKEEKAKKLSEAYQAATPDFKKSESVTKSGLRLSIKVASTDVKVNEKLQIGRASCRERV